jgi:hypothetical protein
MRLFQYNVYYVKGAMTMYRTKIFKTAAIFLGFFAISVLAGCAGTGIYIGAGSRPSPAYEDQGPPPWAPAHGNRAKHSYRYFPAERVYFDQGGGLYFYYRDGKWQMSASLPITIRVSVNNFVTLEMDSDRPYEYDNEVVKRYPPGQAKKADQGNDKKKDNKKGK